MKIIYKFILLFASAIFCTTSVRSQSDAAHPVKVAIFIPLYADDAYTGTANSLGKANLPKGMLPGLEFYNGVMMAIDSLNMEGTFAEISIYDTKQTGKTIADVFNSAEFNNVGLIIAAITNPAELKAFSEEALHKNIPLISATYPTYIGVKDNPFFVLLNSSIQTHVEGIYRHVKKYYSSNEIIAVTKKGNTETFIKNYITERSKSSPLKIKWITVDETKMTAADLQLSLDSTKNNVVLVASPNESFGLNIVKILSSNEAYKTVAIGMPTWDNIRDLDKPDCKNVEVVFSTPFLYYSQNKSLSSGINTRYKEKFFSRPSDMVFRGYETTYHFTKLLVKHKYNLVNNLSDKDFTVFNEFKLEPLKVSKTSTKPDLLENKKLYFIKKQQGVVKAVI